MWDDVDKRCEKCGQVTEKAKGINKQNIKRLFSFKITLDNFITLFMLFMFLIGAYTYQHDIKMLREFYEKDCSLISMLNINQSKNIIAKTTPQDFPFNAVKKDVPKNQG